MTTLPTPSLVIDLPTVKRNLARLADYATQHNLAIRPHTKTHKSIRMAKLQMEAGAVGLTAAKVGEAVTMAQASRNLFVAYPALDPWRREHLAALAKNADVRVGFDSAEAATWIAQAARSAGVTIGVLVDLDVGLHRTGVQSPAEALTLARHVSNTPGLRLDGIMCYPGFIRQPLEQQKPLLEPVAAMLEETIDLWRRDGFEVKVVSGGSTPSAYGSHHVPQVTEIRPGTYIYNDMSVVSCGYVGIEDCAARFHCTVVSTAVPGKFVIDAGSKTLTQDRRTVDPDTAGFGHVVEYPHAKIVKLSEEHGEVDASQCDRRPKVGDRVTVIPNHICPCVNLQTMAWVRESDGTLEPLPIDARGQVW
jgi:D-serine deaminase-like pyridoxal phosphate-dependent protein